MNTFGSKWSFTSFGESHGAAIGGVLDGVPAGITIDLDLIRTELDKRAGRTQNGLKTDTQRSHPRNTDCFSHPQQRCTTGGLRIPQAHIPRRARRQSL